MKRFIFFLFIIILSACSSNDKQVKIPENILSKGEMAAVMVDIHLLEASLNISSYGRDQVVMNNINPNSDILKKNNITKEKFEESFVFYSENPVLFSEVYQLVLNELSKMQAEEMSKK